MSTYTTSSLSPATRFRRAWSSSRKWDRRMTDEEAHRAFLMPSPDGPLAVALETLRYDDEHQRPRWGWWHDPCAAARLSDAAYERRKAMTSTGRRRAEALRAARAALQRARELRLRALPWPSSSPNPPPHRAGRPMESKMIRENMQATQRWLNAHPTIEPLNIGIYSDVASIHISVENAIAIYGADHVLTDVHPGPTHTHTHATVEHDGGLTVVICAVGWNAPSTLGDVTP